MNIQITARHFHASASLHANLRSEIERLGRFNNSITGAHVILDAQNTGGRRAEMVVSISEKTLSANAIEENMHKAIESMISKMERQLKKEKEKLKVHRSVPMSELVTES